MTGVVEDLERAPHLDDLPRVHHRHPIGIGCHDAEIVRDQDHGHSGGRLDLLEQFQVLGLNGDVERGRRLVGDEQPRRAGKRDRARHSLSHPAAELVGIVPQPRLGGGDPETSERLQHAFAERSAAQPLMEPHHLAHLRADRQRGVQRRHRILQHHGDLLAAHAAHLGPGLAQQIVALEEHAAADDPSGRLGDQTDQGEARHRLSRSRFADERQRLAGVEREADAIHGLRDPATGEKIRLQIVDDQERRGLGHHLALSFTSS